jgi:type IV pilus assembly protein PilB
MKLTQPLIDHIQEKARIPHVSLQGMIKAANNDALEFAQFVIQDGYLNRDVIGELVASQINRTYVNLSKTLFQDDMIALLNGEIAARYQAIPIYQLGKVVTVGMVDPNDRKVITALENLLMKPVSPVFCFRDEVQSAIKVNYQTSHRVDDLVTSFDLKVFQGVQMDDAALAKLLDSKPLVELSDSIILLALKERASDIHIEPKKNQLVVRFRIDGILMDRLFLPTEMGLPLASRYKISSDMDITERRRPQDGRLSFPLPMKSLDLRVSCLPVMYGEKIVMRILGSLYSTSILNLDKLDFSTEVLRPFKATLKHPQGILFVTGPTGSGKSTTLYAALNFINTRDINIITIEDPVEYDVPSLNQVMVNEKVGRGFKEVLRSVLRQDPDAILVGEIRDSETARIAAEAALTGHLVLTTLHTNDAIQATTRLLEMGVERYVVAPAIIGVMGQRLVRRLCEHCKTEYQADPEELRQYFYWQKDTSMPTLYKGAGCVHCGGTGYTGRVGIHEYLKVTPQIREAILRGGNYNEIMNIAVQQGFRNLRYDGLKKALRGITSLNEVIRVTASLDDE